MTVSIFGLWYLKISTKLYVTNYKSDESLPLNISKWMFQMANTADMQLLLLFSRSVMLGFLWPHGLQHARLTGPSPSPRACSKSCPLSQWCHPTVSSSVTSFSCPQSFPTSVSFPMNQLFASGGQSIGASSSASVPPVNIQDWFPLGLTSLIPCSPRDSQ